MCVSTGDRGLRQEPHVHTCRCQASHTQPFTGCASASALCMHAALATQHADCKQRVCVCARALPSIGSHTQQCQSTWLVQTPPALFGALAAVSFPCKDDALLSCFLLCLVCPSNRLFTWKLGQEHDETMMLL